MFVKQVTIGKQVSWTFLGLLEVSVGAVREISRIALWQCQCLFTMQWIYVSTARKNICNVFMEMHEQWTKNTIRADPDMPPFLSRDLICKWITCGLMIWCVHCKLHCWHVQPSVCRTLRQWFFAMSNSWVAFSVLLWTCPWWLFCAQSEHSYSHMYAECSWNKWWSDRMVFDNENDLMLVSQCGWCIYI